MKLDIKNLTAEQKLELIKSTDSIVLELIHVECESEIRRLEDAQVHWGDVELEALCDLEIDIMLELDLREINQKINYDIEQSSKQMELFCG